MSVQTAAEPPDHPWSGGRRHLPSGTRVLLPGGECLRLQKEGLLQEPRVARDAETSMEPPLCEHHRDQWELEVAPSGLDELGHRQFRTRVTHTYEVPGRMQWTYGGEPYVQHGVDVGAAGQPSLGGFLPPGAPPPTRYPEHVPRQFWEWLLRRTEVTAVSFP